MIARIDASNSAKPRRAASGSLLPTAYSPTAYCLAAMTAAISVHNLVKRFGTKTVVDHVSMTVDEGEIVGFLGPNGSGKTTTIRIMCGLLTPDEGDGKVLGYDLRTEALKIKREVGYMTQKFSFYEDLTIGENLEFVARLYQFKPVAEHVERTLDELGLTVAPRPACRHAVRRLETAPGARRLHHAQAETPAAR